ncbi:serpin (serine protease inhibitor) domain-containing protein [Phthorimaea operculella]|nr:serpin (serine protease inhibitor) domain-containing protein [Phthorimaea operculella]
MDYRAVSSNISKFSAKFCNELEKDKSVVCSPLSAEYLLSLIALGADEPSHSELLTALGFRDKDEIRSAFSTVSSKLRSQKSVTLNVANRIYVKEGPYQLEPGLLEDAIKVFDAAIEKIDFNQSKDAASTINQWVEEQTKGKIKDIVSPGALDSRTRIVLVNAIYFKGTWKEQFRKHHTQPQDFHINANTTIKVPMMYNEHEFNYYESVLLRAQLLEMPYVGNEASMVIILPWDIEGLNSIVQILADGYYDIQAELKNMYHTKVHVSLPKFKIETEINTKDLLEKIGIKSMFNSKINTGLNNLLRPPEAGVLYVSQAVQKVFIEVNEEGAEAAAAFAMGMVLLSARRPPPPKIFKANRPFLVTILVQDIPIFYAKYYAGNQCIIPPGQIDPSLLVMGMVLQSAGQPPPPKIFKANRPFLVTILVQDIPIFYAKYFAGNQCIIPPGQIDPSLVGLDLSLKPAKIAKQS